MQRADEDDGDVEARRVAFLRRHRESLLQQQRLDTERRAQERTTDRRQISEREAAVRQDKAVGAHTKAAERLSPGTYADVDTLDVAALQRVADTQVLRELAPIHTAGKYHVRYMKDRYPIAGAQLRIEKERETFLAAKKKLLLDSTAREQSRQRGVIKGSTSAEDVALLRQRASYGKLDFHIDAMTRVLEREQQRVDRDGAERQIRLIDIRHPKALEQFWELVHTERHREAVTWLRSHTFTDVNIPVVCSGSRPFSARLDRDFGVAPLMAACSLLNVEMVACLLEHGAFVPITTGNGDSALHFLWRDWSSVQAGALTTDASVKGVAELARKAQRVFDILELLLTGGARVNEQNAFGETALQFCARFGLEECANLLLRHGADPFVADRHGKSAAQYALEHRHDDLHRVLLNYAVIERVRSRESERAATGALLRKQRGLLAASWSQQSLETFKADLAVQDQRVGRLRKQYVDRRGNVIVASDDD